MTPIHHFCFDVESLGVESTSVVLSAAIVKFDIDPKDLPKTVDLDSYYETLLTSALMVKFDVAEQTKKYKRTMEKETIDWWNKQGSLIKKASFTPSDYDDSVESGILKLRNYITMFGGAKNIIWVRGSLDQMCIDSLAKSAGLQPIAPYHSYRDIRTAIDLLADSPSINGYCELKYEFNKDLVHKHHPVHDVAYDSLMLTFMKTE